MTKVRHIIMDNTHPLAADPSAVRLVEHNLLDIETILGAHSTTVDGNEVVFRRRPVGATPAVSWEGRLGDWLVRDGAGWRIVPDAEPLTPQELSSTHRQRTPQR